MTVLALGKVDTQIYVVGLAELKANAGSAAGQEVLVPKHLIAARYHFPQSAERCETQFLVQDQPILQLGAKHVPIQITTGGVTAQLVVCAIDAICVKGGLACSKTSE